MVYINQKTENNSQEGNQGEPGKKVRQKYMNK